MDSAIRSASAQRQVGKVLGRVEFDLEQADIRLMNYNKLIARTVDVFGNEITASRWLSSVSPDFGGMTPLEAAARCDYEIQALEPVLLRLEHGIDF